MKRTKSERLFFKEKKLRKRKFIIKHIQKWYDDSWFEENQPNRYNKFNLSCGCYACGNPRKYYGELSNQEKRINEVEKEYDPFDKNCFYVTDEEDIDKILKHSDKETLMPKPIIDIKTELEKGKNSLIYFFKQNNKI